MPNSQFSNVSHAILPVPITVVPASTVPEGQGCPSDASVISWFDSRNKKRSVVVGRYLCRYEFSFNDGQNEIHRIVDADLSANQGGFGYLVSHAKNGNSPLGRDMPGEMKTLFLGEHHVIHRVVLHYRRSWGGEDGGHGIEIPAVIDWFVATGRDHPIWAVTWKISEAINPESIDFDQDEFRMDVRAPYGIVNFDGGEGGAIGGIGWGDCEFRFRTDTEPFTLNSAWRYKTPNTVNFVQAWIGDTTNAEMGIVQTRVSDDEMGYPDRVKAHERQHTSAEADKGNCGEGIGDYLMPCFREWPYQLMNYDWEPQRDEDGNLRYDKDGNLVHKSLDEPTSTKLLAWGTPYGWLGASSTRPFETFGNTPRHGTGHRCYATFVVLGPKSRKSGPKGLWTQTEGDVERAIDAVVALNDGEISSVTVGAVSQSVRRGPDSYEQKESRIVGGNHNGYNDTYAAYYLNADQNRVAFTFQPTMGPVKNPVFVIQGFTAGVPNIMIGIPAGSLRAAAVNAGAASDALASINAAAKELWITILDDVKQAVRIEIAG